MAVAEVEIDLDQLLYGLEHDSEFAINYFLATEVDEGTPVPDFHIEGLDLMCSADVTRVALAMPRDHAKTTLAKIAVLHHCLFKSHRFTIYLSNTHTVAAQATLDIVNFLRGENFTKLHFAMCGAPIDWVIAQESNGLYKFTLFKGTTSGRYKEKTCIMRALGAGQQVRGINVDNQRPELAIVDDFESDESLDKHEGYAKNKKWFYGPFRKCLDKFNNKIVQLGNLIATKCLLNDHLESKFWHSRRYGCIRANGEALWPEAWPLNKLRLDFEEYKTEGMMDVWFAEMMNMPIAFGLGLITAEEIFYRPALVGREDIEFGFITIDPAISNEAWGHRTAIVVHGFVSPYWQICEYHAERGVDPITMFNKMLELAYRWGISTIGIESVAFQSALKFMFDHLCLEQHIEGLTFVDLYASRRKAERIAVWASEIKRKGYAVPDNDMLITQQLLTFDPLRKDNDCDLIDSCAYGPQMIQYYMADIMNTLPGGQQPKGVYAELVDFAEV